jgi:hypothetical protein
MIALIVAGASLALSAVAACLAGLLYIRAVADPLPVQSSPEPATAAQVEAVAHVTLPPGTVLLSAAYSNGLDTRLSALLRLPRSGLDAFVDSGQFTAPLTAGQRSITATHNVGGGNLWRPEQPVSVSGLHENEPTADGTYRVVMLDLDDRDTVTVFLYASRG